MSNIGITELLVIFGIALLLFGNRLPQVGKALGEGIRDFKRGLRDNNDSEAKNETTSSSSSAHLQAMNNPAQGLTPPSASQHASHRNPEHIIDVQHVNK